LFLASDITRRVDFALFVVAAAENDVLVHEAPGILGRQTPSALTHAPANELLHGSVLRNVPLTYGPFRCGHPAGNEATRTTYPSMRLDAECQASEPRSAPIVGQCLQTNRPLVGGSEPIRATSM
jgi:hypothetical protein